MYTNTNLNVSYVHKYKSYSKLCTQIQIIHTIKHTNTNILVYHVHKTNIIQCS
jgi:hypothetical protein